MLIRKTRTAQWPLVASYTYNVTDQVIGTNNGAIAANQPFAADVIGLPPGATVMGGALIVELASDSAGTVSVGDSANPTRYLAATSTATAARTPLTLTGYKGNGEDIRITQAGANGSATVGRVSVLVQYIVANRANEVQIT